LNKERAA
jgi:hypothetical protein